MLDGINYYPKRKKRLKLKLFLLLLLILIFLGIFLFHYFNQLFNQTVELILNILLILFLLHFIYTKLKTHYSEINFSNDLTNISKTNIFIKKFIKFITGQIHLFQLKYLKIEKN